MNYKYGKLHIITLVNQSTNQSGRIAVLPLCIPGHLHLVISV